MKSMVIVILKWNLTYALGELELLVDHILEGYETQGW